MINNINSIINCFNFLYLQSYTSYCQSLIPYKIPIMGYKPQYPSGKMQLLKRKFVFPQKRWTSRRNGTTDRFSQKILYLYFYLISLNFISLNHILSATIPAEGMDSTHHYADQGYVSTPAYANATIRRGYESQSILGCKFFSSHVIWLSFTHASHTQGRLFVHSVDLGRRLFDMSYMQRQWIINLYMIF